MVSHVHPVPFALASASSSCEGCNHLRTGSTKSLNLRWTWKVENYWDIKWIFSAAIPLFPFNIPLMGYDNKFRCYPQQLESFCVFAKKSAYAIKIQRLCHKNPPTPWPRRAGAWDHRRCKAACRTPTFAPGPRNLSVTGLEAAAGRFSFHCAQGPAQGVCYGAWNCGWAQGQAQGVYLSLLLGMVRSTGPGAEECICYASWNCCWALFIHWTGPKAGLKESISYASWNCCWTLFVPLGATTGRKAGPRSLSVTGVGQGRTQGVSLALFAHWAQGCLRVLKLRLGMVGHFSFHWAQAGPICYGYWNCCWAICYGSWNCCWALAVPLGPRPGTRNLSVAGLKLPLRHFSFHWAKAGQKESMLRVLKLPLGARPGPRSLSVTGLETAVGCWALFVPLGRRPGSRSLSAYLLRVWKLHIRYAVIFLNAGSCLLCFLHVLS